VLILTTPLTPLFVGCLWGHCISDATKCADKTIYTRGSQTFLHWCTALNEINNFNVPLINVFLYLNKKATHTQDHLTDATNYTKLPAMLRIDNYMWLMFLFNFDKFYPFLYLNFLLRLHTSKQGLVY
jgi:hypothetical protein